MRASGAFKVMRHNPPRHTSADLDAILDDRRAPADPLSRLVAAAKAPGQPWELAGLEAATAVFMTAAASPIDGHLAQGMIMMPDRHRRTIAAKLVAAVAGILAVGGVAYAATSVGAANSAHRAPASSATDSSSATASQSATTSSSATESSPVGSGSTSASGTESPSHPVGTPSPSLVGLCRAWLARPADAGKADQSAAFTVLVTAAGGKDNVIGYCATVLGSPSASASDGSPSAAATPSHGKPGSLPTSSSAGGKPSSVPPHSKPSPLPTPSHP